MRKPYDLLSHWFFLYQAYHHVCRSKSGMMKTSSLACCESFVALLEGSTWTGSESLPSLDSWQIATVLEASPLHVMDSYSLFQWEIRFFYPDTQRIWLKESQRNLPHFHFSFFPTVHLSCSTENICLEGQWVDTKPPRLLQCLHEALC